ncbi:hypothetical protein [Streptomyces sp. KL116D]|uniref:hypothetical protein n=1 Tax=Streptomyces sp. KL116D TaxID=3045152 RepID=UPI003555DE83
MRDGDRLWIYFGGVEGKIAAMAHVKSSPRPAPIGSQKPYEFDAELDLKATTALSKSPVRLRGDGSEAPAGMRGDAGGGREAGRSACQHLTALTPCVLNS